MLPYAGIVPVLLLFEFTLAQNVPLRGPPQFEMNPQYLDSYIPASMQVIAYLTEMMKYDIKPTVTTTTTHRPTTTKRRPTNRPITIQLTTKRPLFTAPPTPYHKPALYAPYHPPGFIITRNESPLMGETSTVDSYAEYVNRLKNPLADYFDRYRQVDSISSIIDQLIRQRRATPFNYTSVPTEKSIRNDVPNARRSSSGGGDLILFREIRAKPFVHEKANTNVVRQNIGQEFLSIKNSREQPAEKKPELSRSRSIRSVLEEVEEPSSPILQRKIRANPFTPVKANTNVVRQNNGQEFRSNKNSRGQAAEKKPELSRSRSIRSVLEEVEEPSSPILQRKIRANPFTPVKANTNVVRQNNGQEFRSNKNSRGQPAEKKPELNRSRSIRSVLEEVEEPSSPILQRKIRANPFTPVKANTNVVRQNNGQEFRSNKNSRGQAAEKKPELSRSRSIRSVLEEVEEPSSPILQRKIRANPFTPVKANTNVVRQNNGQEFRSNKNSRGQAAEKKPELSRSRSIRSVLEEVEEPSSPILQRKIRANPFTPLKANTNVVRQNNGQEFRSNKNSRGQAAEKKPELSRSRSIRSVVEEILIEAEIESDIINQGEVLSDGTTISIGGLNSASEKISVGKVPLLMTDLRRTPLLMTVSSDTKVKGRALSINGDNFNVRSVDYLGFGLNELIKEIQSERESVENRLTDDDRVKLFSTKYDDVNFGSYLLRQKKIPPTKAYVTLLSLYDLLNKESKKLMLNKYNGYATAIVEELIETSSGTSSEQLRTILQRIVDRPDTYDPPIRSKITSLVTDLSTSNSYINDALRYIPPLPFSR